MSDGDTPEAALAAALAVVHMTDPAFIQGAATHTREQASEHAGEWMLDAAAILPAMPDWTLVPASLIPRLRQTVEEGHDVLDQQRDEIARLRAALVKAENWFAEQSVYSGGQWLLDEIRLALSQEATHD